MLNPAVHCGRFIQLTRRHVFDAQASKLVAQLTGTSVKADNGKLYCNMHSNRLTAFWIFYIKYNPEVFNLSLLEGRSLDDLKLLSIPRHRFVAWWHHACDRCPQYVQLYCKMYWPTAVDCDRFRFCLSVVESVYNCWSIISISLCVIQRCRCHTFTWTAV